MSNQESCDKRSYNDYFKKIILGWDRKDHAARLASCLKLIAQKHPEAIEEILRLNDNAMAYDATPDPAGSMFNDWGDYESRKKDELLGKPFIRIMEIHKADVACQRNETKYPKVHAHLLNFSNE